MPTNPVALGGLEGCRGCRSHSRFLPAQARNAVADSVDRDSRSQRVFGREQPLRQIESIGTFGGASTKKGSHLGHGRESIGTPGLTSAPFF